MILKYPSTPTDVSALKKESLLNFESIMLLLKYNSGKYIYITDTVDLDLHSVNSILVGLVGGYNFFLESIIKFVKSVGIEENGRVYIKEDNKNP